MRYGLATFATKDGIPLPRLARMAEDLGFESLFLPEHTHIPASRETVFPWADELPTEYSHSLDPFVALASAACATERLRIGTGVCLVVQRDPITTAKEVATLDLVSAGRFLFGVGAGWNLEEMRNHGTDPGTRFALMHERVEAMRAIWMQDEASYHGRYVDFDRIWAWPKPVQRPHPPVLVGGNGPKVLDRVVAYGDEWLPEPEEGLTERIAELQRRARNAGRLDGVPVTVYGAEPDQVEDLERAGVHRCVFWLPADASAAEQRLDELVRELPLSL